MFVKKTHFSNILEAYIDLICSGLSIASVLERLVLKNLPQRTSQRVKIPSGARVVPCSRSLDRSIARSSPRSLDRSLGRSLDRAFDRSLDSSIARSLDRSITRSFARSLDRSLVELDIQKTPGEPANVAWGNWFADEPYTVS